MLQFKPISNKFTKINTLIELFALFEKMVRVMMIH
ncbi:Terminase large subunit (plasmid) [Borrelia hermsii YBT]|uniref:Terminase large subunit n=1 Tax=Borrelia hermsii YBT TaxID=1313295 RepID=W5T218_BORHE|nr:Terminase large subunit [Borrelia hermsii YBT]